MTGGAIKSIELDALIDCFQIIFRRFDHVLYGHRHPADLGK